MPISGALVTPASCWQIGPTTFAIAGSSPADPGSGAVAVINGQAQSLQLVPGSGQLRIVSSDASLACTVGPGGTYRSLDLGDGKLGPATAGACAAGPPGPTSSGATANLLSQTVQPAAAISTISVSLPPPVSPSYYEYYSYLGDCASGSGVPCPLFQQGQATYSPSPAGIVVLDFGAPCYVVNAQNVYGTQLFGDYTVCVPDSTIQGLVSAWIRGYESDHGAGTTPITLAIGTSNSLTGVDPGYTLTNAQMQVTGQDWYQQVVAATGTAGLAAPVTAWGASDMEQSSSGNWYPGTPTVDWAQGYSSASPAKSNCSQSQTGYLADYGDDVLGGSGSGDGWTVSQVYQVAWGIPAACAVPEIYHSTMASEWQALSQWGSQNSSSGAIIFTGVMTESGAGYTPTQGWDQLQQATGQNIPTLTNIGQSLQGQPPQVSSVAPAQGPPAGGTTVVISGANLLGTQAVYFGANPAASFTVDSGNQVTATSPAGSPGFVDVVVETSLGSSGAQGTDGFVYASAGAYHPLAPARIEDTRPGSGFPGSGHPPGPGGVTDVQVAGQGGVPSTGVAAVLVNVTIADPTADGFVTAYPTGLPVPLVSTVNFSPGSTKANLALVTLGRGGAISIFNAAGTTQVIVDVEGWYANSTAATGGALLNSVSPQRIVDTRPGSGYPYAGQTIGPGGSLTIQVAGVGGIPATGAQAVVMNLTETGATASSFLIVFPAGAARPTTSNLNFTAGETAANQVVMALSSSGQVTIYNNQGSVNVIVDVAGWFGVSGSALNSLVPARAVDTRPNSGEPYAGQTLGPGQALTVNFAGLAGLPASGITALAINVTVTDTLQPGVLLVGPGGQPVPQTSEVNWVTGQITENLVLMGVGPNASVTFYNGSSASVDLVVDVYGWYG